MTDKPYVVLVGDVGVGKSLLVEKITGKKNRSSDADQSETKSSEAFHSIDGSFIVCDTPGTNPIEEKFEHNIWIAFAMNIYPVSRILIVVMAHKRIDKVVDEVRKYAEGFMTLEEIVGVCVTHTDTVNWEHEKCKRLIEQELGVTNVNFSSLTTKSEQLIADISATFTNPLDVTITSDNFFNFFKVHNNNLKILNTSRREVTRLKIFVEDLYSKISKYELQEQMDLIFEFQAWVTEQVLEAQMRVSDKNNFLFDGPELANEAGYIANLTNQLRLILYDVRINVLSHAESQFRKCPYCGLIWTKVTGCDGSTTCGNRVNAVDKNKSVLATFSFSEVNERLVIEKVRNQEQVHGTNTSFEERGNIGCGKSITWREMAPVQVPDSILPHIPLPTENVAHLPPKAMPMWEESFNKKMSSLSTKQKVDSKDLLSLKLLASRLKTTPDDTSDKTDGAEKNGGLLKRLYDYLWWTT